MPDQPEDKPELDDIDPRDFVRAVLGISPEDAKRVRDASPVSRKPKGQTGPVHDYGDAPAED